MMLMMHAIILLSLSLLVAATDRPIIGILTQPNGHDHAQIPPSWSFINADYVKWIEVGGVSRARMYRQGVYLLYIIIHIPFGTGH